MGISIYNDEHYVDPTPYEALKHVEGEQHFPFMPVVYICSPYSGQVELNVENAKRYSRFAIDSGYIPIAPHTFLPELLDDDKESERALALYMDNVYLSKCAQLWVFGDVKSSGMDKEIKYARRKNIRIRYFSNKCVERSNAPWTEI